MAVIFIKILNIVNYVAVDHKNILVTIIIKINEFCAKSQIIQTGLTQPRKESLINKGTGFIIDIEGIGFTTEIGHKQIQPAILINI